MIGAGLVVFVCVCALLSHTRFYCSSLFFDFFYFSILRVPRTSGRTSHRGVCSGNWMRCAVKRCETEGTTSDCGGVAPEFLGRNDN